jgi:ABC-type multidrug transport system permease subunit
MKPFVSASLESSATTVSDTLPKAVRSASLATANFRPSPQSVGTISLGASKKSIEKPAMFAAASVMIVCCSALRASNFAWFMTRTVGNGQRFTFAVTKSATSYSLTVWIRPRFASIPSTVPSRRAA